MSTEMKYQSCLISLPLLLANYKPSEAQVSAHRVHDLPNENRYSLVSSTGAVPRESSCQTQGHQTQHVFLYNRFIRQRQVHPISQCSCNRSDQDVCSAFALWYALKNVSIIVQNAGLSSSIVPYSSGTVAESVALNSNRAY